MHDKNEQNYKTTTTGLLEYVGPQTLESIQSRLLEIQEERPRRLHNLKENYSSSIEDEMEAMDISFLDVEQAKLEMKRQFILDRREGWKAKVVWNIVVPIFLAIITAYFVAHR